MSEPVHPSATRARVRRDVTSFVRRSSRMRPQHRRAWERSKHAYVLEVPRRELSTSVAPGHPLNLPVVFGREAPLVVEIGFGTGESLVAMAGARPDVDVLAFEVYLPGIARAVNRLHEDGVGNVRLVQADAVEGLTHLLGSASVSEVWTFFPDPWPKARHHKRRLVDRAFVDLVASRLRPGGAWRLATDWADYADHMRGLLDPHPAFDNVALDVAVDNPGRAGPGSGDGWAERFIERPLTRFEQRGLDAGRTVRDLHYRRR